MTEELIGKEDILAGLVKRIAELAPHGEQAEETVDVLQVASAYEGLLPLYTGSPTGGWPIYVICALI